MRTIDTGRLRIFHKKFYELHPDCNYYADFLEHAMFPKMVSSNLLYSIYQNFTEDEKGNKFKLTSNVVSDILQSTLVTTLSTDLFEFTSEIRNFLLERMRFDPNYGRARILKLAKFLLEYIESPLAKKDFINGDLLLYKYTALIWLEPEKTASKLLKAMKRTYRVKDYNSLLSKLKKVAINFRPTKRR